MSLMDGLNIALAILLMVVVGLALAYVYMWYKNRTTESNGDNKSKEEKTKQKASEYTKKSIFEFMQFDKIEDNMIVQDNGEKYLMVIECEGVNYDLMSEMEKVAVEAGFVQFLNSLRYTIQIYTQTRTINIEDSLVNYRQKLEEIAKNLENKNRKYASMLQAGETDQKLLQDTKMEVKRLQNLYEYGADVVENIAKISQNKNVLRKHYYIVVPYYTSELASDLLDEEEKRNMVFNELYTRAQAIIRTLYACSMKCKILDSYELADLLYVAYNRDEAEVYGIDKALRAGYTELYSTGQDVVEKKINALDRKMEEDALKLAVNTIEEVKSEKTRRLQVKEKSFEELVKEMAEKMLKENSNIVGKEVAQEAINKIEKTKEKGGEKNEKAEKRTRANKTE